MAYVYVGARHEYVGLSTDTKPTVNAVQGMILYETDTGDEYVYNGTECVIRYRKVNVESIVATDVTLSGSKAQEYESLTIANTAGGVALTAAKYGTCTKAFITVESAQIRWTIDGTAPTTTVGHLANAYDIIDLTSAEDIAAFRAIRVGTTSGTIHCTYSI